MFARFFSKKRSSEQTSEERISLLPNETKDYQMIIDADTIVSKRLDDYQLNTYIKKYIAQFKTHHATSNIKILILVAKESDRYRYLDDLCLRYIADTSGFVSDGAELSDDEQFIMQCKLISYNPSSSGATHIDYNSLLEVSHITPSEHTIVLTSNKDLLRIAREKQYTTVECFPAGTITHHTDFLETFSRLSEKGNLTAFLDIDGTTIITVGSIKKFNPHLLELLKQIKEHCAQVNLHFLTCKHSPTEQLCQLRQMLREIISVTETLISEPKCDKKTLQECQSLVHNMYTLCDKINEAIRKYPIKESSGKEEGDAETFEEESKVIPLDKKLKALIKFSALEKPSLRKIQSRLKVLQNRYERFNKELPQLLENLEGPFSADTIIELFKTTLQLDTPITFTYLGTREETPWKIGKIIEILKAQKITKEIVLFIDNEIGELAKARPYREELAKQEIALNALYVYGENEPSLPSRAKPREQEETTSRFTP